jgi:hypothetical protein
MRSMVVAVTGGASGIVLGVVRASRAALLHLRRSTCASIVNM